MSPSASDIQATAPLVRNALGKLDSVVKLYTLRPDNPEARRMGTELYYELLRIVSTSGTLQLDLEERGLLHAGELVLQADATPWVSNLWTAGFRRVELLPGLEDSELRWFLELLADEEARDLAWRAWARNMAQLRFQLAALPPVSRDVEVEVGRLAKALESAVPPSPRAPRVEPWEGDPGKDFVAPDPKLRHSIVRELQAESVQQMGQRLLFRLTELFRARDAASRKPYVEDLGWVLWHFAQQPELRGSTRLLRELQEICRAEGLTAFGEDNLARRPASAAVAPVTSAPVPPTPAAPEQAEPPAEVRERLGEILRKREASPQDVAELLRQAELSALPLASGLPVDDEVSGDPVEQETPGFRAYKGIKFTVSGGAAEAKPSPSQQRERRSDSGFWKVDTDSQGDDVIDTLFSEVFGDEEAAAAAAPPPRSAAPRHVPPAEPHGPIMDVEESSIDLSALGFDPALLKPKAPAVQPAKRQRRPDAAPAAPAAPATGRRRDSEPDRPELLWSDMSLNEEPEEEDDEPLFQSTDEDFPPPRVRPEDAQQADTQKLSLAEVAAAAAAQRSAASQQASGRSAAPSPPARVTAPESDAAQRARVMRAQGRMVEARHFLHRHLKEVPQDRAAEEEFRKIQHELRQSCLAQLRNDDLVPQLQLPPGSPQHQALLQAPAGGVLRRVNGASSLREIRVQLQLTTQEFERQMLSLMEWGFVALASRRR